MPNLDANVVQNKSGNESNSMAVEIFEDVKSITGDVEDIVESVEDVFHVFSGAIHNSSSFLGL